MEILRYTQESFVNLWAAKLRSLLALLGMMVGTASVVAMISGGELAARETLKQFASLGTDLMALSISSSDEINISDNTISTASFGNLLKKNNQLLAIAPYVLANNVIQYHADEFSTTLLGVTENFAKIAEIKMSQGRFISDLDSRHFYCVLGIDIFERFKKSNKISIIGDQIKINNIYFTVVGIAKPWAENSFIYANINNSILLPLSTALMINKSAQINNVLFQLKSEANIEQVKKSIENFLQPLAQNNQFFFRSAKELLNRMKRQGEILTVFLGLIGCISLLVSGIGIMNIMLVSITERRREIGIRLALGAMSSNILLLFLIEASILSIVGATLGVLVGILISYGIALFYQWQFHLLWLPSVLGFSISMVTGLFFGLYPAHKASQLDPIEALRSE